jgi:thiosulfate reductase cytochrome b subunit
MLYVHIGLQKLSYEGCLRTYIHLYLLSIIQIIKNMGVLGLGVFAGGFKLHESSYFVVLPYVVYCQKVCDRLME